MRIKRGPERASQWSEDEARSVLTEWSRSGLSGDRFAREHGYSGARLWYWKKRLGAARAARAHPIEFMPIALPRSPSPNTPATIEIEHEGVVLRVREDLEDDRLAQLISTLVAARRAC